MSQFESLGLSPRVLRSVKSLGFDEPTPIQRDAIPLVLAGKDVMGLAQTGTGKTAAFGLPLVHHLLETNGKPPAKTVRSLILAPTRELVSQIAVHLKTYIRGTPLRVECIMGGTPINRQIRNL
ncbi:MAG: DEAD/DEAH box helicase, partial [Alphaproteobacteria bacterium]|nr:DEAD/DEAH box helicase [Alphaproteobacteria bacterium]